MVVLPDVNVLVYGLRNDMPHHESAKAWLESALAAPVTFAFHPMVGASLIRLCTNPKVFANPSTVSQCQEFMKPILSAPDTIQIAESPTFWTTFTDLLSAYSVKGAEVTDFYIAALALEQNATLWTFDRGFGRIKKLKSKNPLHDTLT